MIVWAYVTTLEQLKNAYEISNLQIEYVKLPSKCLIRKNLEEKLTVVNFSLQ